MGKQVQAAATSQRPRGPKTKALHGRLHSVPHCTPGSLVTHRCHQCQAKTPPRLSSYVRASLVVSRPTNEKSKSTKELRADLSIIKRHLGLSCPHFGKWGVVNLAAPGFADDGSSNRGASASAAKKKAEFAPPRFNKYAGWVEWQNAIFLWINAFGGKFINTFTQGGRQVNWYVGGANPTLNSPIVKRLLDLKGKSRCGEKLPTQILLFVRPEATEPYVFCGKVKYVSHDERKKGFEFTWALQEFDSLKDSEDFQQLFGRKIRGAKAAAMRWA